MEVAESSALLASLHQVEAYPHLEVPAQVVAGLEHLDHCTLEFHHCWLVALLLLVMERLADSYLRVPRKDRWSTESDQNHLAKRQPAVRRRCGGEDTVRQTST